MYTNQLRGKTIILGCYINVTVAMEPQIEVTEL